MSDIVSQLIALGVFPPKKHKGALMYLTADCALAAATPTLISPMAVAYDVGGFTGVANRFTIPSGVKYVQLFGQVIGASQTDQLNAQIFKNGTRLPFSTNTDIDSSGADYSPVFSAPISVMAGDYFQLYAVSQLARNANPGTSNDTWMSINVLE